LIRKKLSFFKSFVFILFYLFVHVQSQTASDAVRLFENEKGFGTIAMGLSGTFTSSSNDFSAIYWNPAGLASIKKSTLNIEFNNNFFLNEVKFLGNTFDNSINDNYLNSLGGTYSVPTKRGSLVLAFGISNIGDYNYKSNFSGLSNSNNNLNFPIIIDNNESTYLFNENVFREEEISSLGKISQVSFGFGILLTEKTSFGMSINSIHNQENYSFKFNQNDSLNKFEIFPADFKSYNINQSLQLNAKGNRISLGFITRLTNTFKTGFNFNMPFNYNVNEKHLLNENLTFDNSSTSDTTFVSNFDYKIKSPYNLSYGISLKLKSLFLATSIKFQNWSNIKLKDNNNSENYFIQENFIIGNEYNSTIQLNLGTKYTFKINNLGTSLILGYSHFPSFIKLDNSSKKETFSSGISINFKHEVICNLSAQQSDWKIFASDNYSPSGTEESIKKIIYSINLIIGI